VPSGDSPDGMGATTRANGMAFSRACSAQFRSAGYLFSVLPASCRQNGTMRHATVCRQHVWRHLQATAKHILGGSPTGAGESPALPIFNHALVVRVNSFKPGRQWVITYPINPPSRAIEWVG